MNILLDIVPEVHSFNWTSIIVTVLGLVGAGGIVKLYAQHSENKKDKRSQDNETEIAFRDELRRQIESLAEELKSMDSSMSDIHESQLELIKENADLKAQLTMANKEILELKAEISILLKRQ